MPVKNIFSKRNNSEVYDDNYIYDELPEKLRVQIIHIINDTIATEYPYIIGIENKILKIHKTLCKEWGVFQVYEESFEHYTEKEQLINAIHYEISVKKVLDVIEELFSFINTFCRTKNHQKLDTELTPDEAIEELNIRFKESSVGYQFENNRIIRIDNIYTHSKIIKPTLTLLNNEKFKLANEEYMEAHEHHKKSENKDCLVKCLKSFESTMKIICDEKEWEYSQNNSSKDLINICINNDLIPTESESEFQALRGLLEHGIPPIRNRQGGHGQGTEKIQVTDATAKYGLNITSSCILFLVELSGI